MWLPASLLALVAFAGPTGATTNTNTNAIVRKKTSLKIATLVPEGSLWEKAYRRMGEEWKRDTDGRVKLKLYAGGVAGDEPDMLRKMRIGQLHGATVTLSGLGEVDPAFKLFDIPMYFTSNAEAQYVLAGMTEIFSERLEKKGFVLLNWGSAGWVHLFSKSPVRTPDDLKSQKLFVWAGSSDMASFWKQKGFQPIPLAVTDIPTGLQTGLIQAVPTTPLSALAFQWFRSTPYMLDVGVLPLTGATIVTKKAWAKLSPEDQIATREAGRRMEAWLNDEVPIQEANALEQMKQRGMEITISEGGIGPWKELADSFTNDMRLNVIPTEILDRGRELRAEFAELAD